MPTARVGDINMYYETHGSGEPLVLLPGYSLDSITCFFRQITGLAENYHVIAVDNRGSGLSDKPDIPYSIDMMAKDTLWLLDALGIRKTHIFGVSMGGMIAQHLVLSHPEITGSLILGCTTCGGRHSVAADKAALAALFDMQGTLEERNRRLLPFVYSQDFIRDETDIIKHAASLQLKRYPPTHAFLRQGEACMVHNTYDRLPEIGVPTLTIAGTEDKLIPAENSRIIASRIPGAECVLLKGVGHLMSVEAPEALNKALLGFLKRHPILA